MTEEKEFVQETESKSVKRYLPYMQYFYCVLPPGPIWAVLAVQ